MSIWKQKITVEEIGALAKNTMISLLGIEFTEIGSDFLSAQMPVDLRTLQPYGLMHGGASCALAETVGSMAGHFSVDLALFYCVGVEINTSHIRAIKGGWVYATAKPLHLGRRTQVWEIPITNEEKKLVSVSRLRLAVLDRQQQ